MTRSIEIVGVGPRDGLQNEAVVVATTDKVALIDPAVEAARSDQREVTLAGMIGVAAPAQISAFVARVVAAIAPLPVGVDFHDMRNTGIANVRAAVPAGAKTVDASLGMLGGCPLATAATGNVATTGG